MSDRGATVPVPGLLTGFVGIALQVAYFAEANTLERATFRVTDAPSGGTVVIALNTQEDGLGSEIEVTIADGTNFATVAGSVAISAGTSLWQFVRSEGGDAMNLSGEYEVAQGAGLANAFTSLARVKADLDVTTTDAMRDLVLGYHIAGVSSRMQKWMDRKIVQLTATTEKIGSIGQHVINTRHYPIISVSSLTENDTALVEDTGFEMEEQDLERGQIIRISGTSPIGWASGTRNIVVTYIHGYVSVPDDLVNAATAQVVYDFFQTQESGKAWRGKLSEGVDPSSAIAFQKDFWEAETVPVMAPYRRKAV